jgi:hypothetical protein
MICIFFAYGCEGREFSLKLFGGKEAIGAKVYVDGAYVGIMEKFGDGSYFSKWLPHGTYKVKIERFGYAPFEEEVTVKKGESEYYMSLQP